MKKLNIIFALIISSFFLLSSNVSADVVTYEINDSDFDYFTDEFYELRELAIEYCNENDMYYLIYSDNGSLFARIFDKTYSFKIYDNSGVRVYIKGQHTKYKVQNNTLVGSGSSSLLNLYFINNDSLQYFNFLDTNVDVIFTSGTPFIIKFNDLSYDISISSKVPTLYEVYQEYQSSQVDPKAEIVTNFYVLIIDKIKLLTNYIASDYIILSALVIFIFVAVIGLVRRLE